MKLSVFFLTVLTASSLLMYGCAKKVGPTKVEIEDNNRRYYPIIQGGKLNMSYKLTNIGKEPFVFVEIQPSCACVETVSYKGAVIRPGRSLILNFTFDSSKNLGAVDHTIRVFGNVEPDGFVAIRFFTNVVPPSGSEPDYEETSKQAFDINNSNFSHAYYLEREDAYE